MDCSLIVTGSWDHKDSNTGRRMFVMQGHTDKVTAVAFSSSGEIVASASRDQTIIVWDTASAHMIHKLQGHTNGITNIALSPNGKLIASAS